MSKAMIARLFVLAVISTLVSVVCLYTQVNAIQSTPRAKRDVSLGLIITWNLGGLGSKSNLENTNILIQVACKVITSADIIALQEAQDFDYAALCKKDYFYYIGSGEFIILVRKSMFRSISKRSYDTLNKQYYSAIVKPRNDSINVIIYNVHLWEGLGMSAQRKATLREIRTNLAYQNIELIIILGDFNTVNRDDISALTSFRMIGRSSVFSYFHQFDGRDPFTTTDGQLHDGILTNKARELEDARVGDFPFNNREPARYAVRVAESIFLRRLVNNGNVLKFADGQWGAAKKLNDCIERYVKKGTIQCPQSWVSSIELSRHLPLLLTISLPSGKQIRLGTWNLAMRSFGSYLTDPALNTALSRTMAKFDILVLQQVLASSESMKTTRSRMRVDFLVKEKPGPSSPYHALYLSRSLLQGHKKIQKEAIALKPSYQYDVALYKVDVRDGPDDVTICLVSVHLHPDTKWLDAISAIPQIANIKQRKDCALFVAMGDFSATNGNVSDMTGWRHGPEYDQYIDRVVPCENQRGFRYTMPVSRDRRDYVLVIDNDGTIGIETCTILRTGMSSLPIEDWNEVSSHYPVGCWM